VQRGDLEGIFTTCIMYVGKQVHVTLEAALSDHGLAANRAQGMQYGTHIPQGSFIVEQSKLIR
jgi:hypothetical protein